MTVDLIPTRVTVTEVHIAQGVRHRCYSCPMALALADLLVEGHMAQVSHESFSVNSILDIPFINLNQIVIPLPPDAIRFVADFDDERPVSSEVFTIPLPRHLLRDSALASSAPPGEGSAPLAGPPPPDEPCPRRSGSP